jgi:DNA-binding CsgD family transcriptional regulator
MALAESAEPHLRSHDQKSWMDRLEADHDNFRSALGWCLRTDRLEEGLRIAAALGWFWMVRSHFSEGSDWYATFLRATEGDYTRVRPRTIMHAVIHASWLAHALGQLEQRSAYAEECLRLADELGDEAHRCWAFLLLARDYIRPDPDRARALLEQGLAAALAADNRDCLRWTFHSMGLASYAAGDFQRAIEESSKAVELHRQASDSNWLLWTLGNLGRAELEIGHLDSARQRFREAIVIARDLPSLAGLEGALIDLARLAVVEGKLVLGVCLVGTADRVRERSGSSLTIGPISQNFLPSLLGRLGDSRATAARTRGRSMNVDEAIDLVLSDEPLEPNIPTVTFDPLSARESELAALIAQGLSNRQIADQLVISVHTVERHVSNILGKLALGSRSQIAVWVTERSQSA